MPQFTSIRPAPDRDNFTFDFTKEIGGQGYLSSVVWSCESSSSDPTPRARIINTPVFDNYKTSALCGDMIDGVTYTLVVHGEVDDGRIITQSADVKCSSISTTVAPLMTVDDFRNTFPQFSDPVKYPDDSITFWLTQVVEYPPIDAHRWGQFYNIGLRLWVAHNLMYMSYANSRATIGGVGGVGTGVATSKSVNGVSLSYDNQFGVEQNAGWYSTTPYGNIFLRYLRMAGTGPMQIGTGYYWNLPGTVYNNNWYRPW